MKFDITKRTGAKVTVENRSTEGSEPVYVVSGYAAVFNSPSDKGGWYTERVAPGAFTEALKNSDVKALLNHDANEILARYKPGRDNNTLELWEDENGLGFRFEMPKSRQDLAEAALRGDLDQNSFAFIIKEDHWEDETRSIEGEDVVWPTREIRKVKSLLDVSLVTYPFYEEANFQVERNSYEALKAEEKADQAEEIYKAAKALAEDSKYQDRINEAVIGLLSNNS